MCLPFHHSRKTLVAEPGVSPGDVLVMSQTSRSCSISASKKHAVRFELTMTGFADRRLNHLGYACIRPWSFVRESNPLLRCGRAASFHLDQRSSSKFGAGEGSRTLTELSLSQLPLPIGPRQHIAKLVRMRGVEPPGAGAHGALDAARLPFRHTRSALDRLGDCPRAEKRTSTVSRRDEIITALAPV